jgi:tripartite-type tricarboxylate transporter receptor subunit TctC
MTKRRSMFIVTSLAMMLLCLWTVDLARTAAWYDGKRITLIVGRTPGGGFERYARTIAPGVQKNLPGSGIMVKNLPGAGGIVAMNEMYNHTKPDGLTFAIEGIGNMVLPQVMADEAVKYKTEDFIFLSRVNSDAHVVTVEPKKGKYQSIEEMKKAKKITGAFTGMGSDDYFACYVLFDALGIPFDPIAGFGGQADAFMSVLAGETDMTMSSWSGARSQVENGTVKPIFVMTKSRLKELPNVPCISDVVPPDKQQGLLGLHDLFDLDRVFFAPPKTPDGIIKDLREAIKKASLDPKINEEAEKQKLQIMFLEGEEVQRRIPDTMRRGYSLKKILQEAMDVSKKKATK